MKESENIEFKKSFAELKAGIVSIAAILNKHGAGELWFGVRNDGKAIGLDAGEKSLRDLSQSIAAHIEPRIYPHVGIEILDGANCVKISFSGKDAPYFAYGRAYMRVADEDRQLCAKELENLILAKNREALCWDREISSYTLDDLDETRLKHFVERAGLVWDAPSNVLEKFDLIKDGRLLNAAQLFFGINPRLQLRCAVFGGVSSATIIDRHDFDGDILELIEEAQKYILKNVHIGMRIKGLEREDVPEISQEAMREAVINAFCHRDYRDPDHVQIAIFKNRLEIRSPGGLFEGLTVEQLKQGNISKRRNPLAADLLRRVHLVEAWGRGVPLILEKEPDVEFKEIAKIFITSFARPSYQESSEQPPQETIDKAIDKTIDKDLSTIEKDIVRMIRANPFVTQKEMAVQLSLSEVGVRYHITKLKAKLIVQRVGGNKAGRWEVV